MEIPQMVVKDIPGMIKVFADGSVSRYDHPLTPASEHLPFEGARSKDIVIDPAKGVSARLFLPDHVPHAQKLPLLFYFHGGGFCFGSTAWENFHLFVSGLASRARVLVISIDYRLAPEHRLPAAYDDCCQAVEWVALGGGKAEPWLESYADYSRCFMAGESAGGNIVHVVGSRTAGRDLGPLNIRGLVAIHPYFGSEERIECEKAASEVDATALAITDLCWKMALPPGSDRDHPVSSRNAHYVGSRDFNRHSLRTQQTGRFGSLCDGPTSARGAIDIWTAKLDGSLAIRAVCLVPLAHSSFPSVLHHRDERAELGSATQKSISSRGTSKLLQQHSASMAGGMIFGVFCFGFASVINSAFTESEMNFLTVGIRA